MNIFRKIKNWWWKINNQKGIEWSKEFRKKQNIYRKYVTKEILEWISNTNELMALATAAYEANSPDIYPSNFPSKPHDWGEHGNMEKHDEIWVEHLYLSVLLHELILSKCNSICPKFYNAYRFSKNF